MEEVVLVNERDEQIGTMEKMEVHEKGLLHRAFSICVFNDKDELLIQKRAIEKYHSGGLWTNTCCSHPRPKESLLDAAHRRLGEEMGFDCILEPAFHFVYHAKLDQGLTEHELDHVIFGKYNKKPIPNPDEVMDFKWMSLEDIAEDMMQNPLDYTSWFKICFKELESFVMSKIIQQEGWKTTEKSFLGL